MQPRNRNAEYRIEAGSSDDTRHEASRTIKGEPLAIQKDAGRKKSNEKGWNKHNGKTSGEPVRTPRNDFSSEQEQQGEDEEHDTAGRNAPTTEAGRNAGGERTDSGHWDRA